MTLAEAIEEFLTARRVDGLAAKTISTYKDILKPFDVLHGHQQLNGITTKMIRAYIEALMNSERSSETVKSIIRTLHVFWTWASAEYTVVNPMKNIKYPNKPKQRALEPLTTDKIKRLFAAARQSSNPDRDSLILWVLLDTGIRAGGLVGLKWSSVHLEQRTMYVTEKGDKGRIVAYSTGTAYLLRKWQYQYGRRDYVFCGVGHDPLTVSGLYQIVRKIGDAAGVKDVFPHALRHNFAMNWMENGGEITALQKQMGHSRIDTTIQFYLRFAPSTLVKAHRGISVPLNVLRD